MRELTKAVEEGRSDSELYLHRAAYLLELERLDEAEADVHLAEPSVDRDMMQAQIAERKGADQDAMDIYESVLEADPDRTIAARRLAGLLVRTRSLQPQALEIVWKTFRTQLDSLPGTGDWVPWISFLHERFSSSGAWDRELELLLLAARRNPLESNPRLGLWMVEALLATDSLDRAVEVAAILPVESGKEAAMTAARRLARALISANRYAPAAELYDRLALGADPAAEQMAAMLRRAPEGERFVLLDRVGTGAMAEVWRAFDLHSGSEVGMKVLHESVSSDPAIRNELEREYEALTRSLSPRLVRAIPGTLAGDRFALELLDHSLAERLSKSDAVSGLPLGECVRIAQQIAEALDYLHTTQVVFQDLSPQNILFRGPDVKLADLGGLSEGPSDTSSATVAKIAYASPEQCARLMGAAASPVDRRSDLYSLGVVLYQMVTGRLPFEGPDQAVLHAHLYATPVAPRIRRPAISLELNALILQSMSRDPADRPPTAAEIWQALAALPEKE